jgi:hypothetical protein
VVAADFVFVDSLKQVESKNKCDRQRQKNCTDCYFVELFKLMGRQSPWSSLDFVVVARLFASCCLLLIMVVTLKTTDHGQEHERSIEPASSTAVKNRLKRTERAERFFCFLRCSSAFSDDSKTKKYVVLMSLREKLKCHMVGYPKRCVVRSSYWQVGKGLCWSAKVDVSR